MSNELRTSLPSGMTLTGRLMNGDTIVVSSIAMTESLVLPGLYRGSVPTGTPAGTYDAVVMSAGVVVAGPVPLVWSGSAELPAGVNITHVNSTRIAGTGGSGDTWRPV